MSSIAMEKGVATQPFIRCIAAPLFAFTFFYFPLEKFEPLGILPEPPL